MGRRRMNQAIEEEKKEQYERGQRIKKIREQELKMNETYFLYVDFIFNSQ